jgi:signal transduction histidine kinase/DNA-binding response OmpR family regulator
MTDLPQQSEQMVKILLVDDRPENLIALESVLDDLGQHLVKAGSGREALRHLLRDDFAVILLDVQMPDMDGFETAELIRSRERSKHTPIVFLTAINKTDTHVSRGYSVGGVDYIFKPFEPEILKAKVSAFVELARKTKELEEETRQRRVAEEKVRRLNADLERRVAQRTAELQAANRGLEAEVAERRRVEEERTALLERERAARAEAEAAQRRLAFLNEASTLLSASLEYRETLQSVARLAVPYLGDFCVVDLLEPEGHARRVAVAHVDPQKEALLRELPGLYQGAPPRPAGRALETGRSELVAEIPDRNGAEGVSSEHAEAFRELAPKSCLAVPLVARGTTLGVMSFCAGEPNRYGPAEQALAEDLARHASAAIDNARLFEAVQEAGRRKDEFLAMLAHELRTPLAAISNADYVLGGLEPSDDERAARLRGIVSRQTRHLARLVDDLLDISRITRGKIELRKEPMDLAAVVQRAADAAAPFITLRRQELSVGLPPEPLWLEADPTRVEQVLSNLLHNASKYSDAGARIAITLEREGDTAFVRVSDTGMGIPPALLPRVFDLFAQAERTPDRSQGGLGIGLALVRSLVRLHGGEVSASSEGVGKGSEFTVRLPALRRDFAPPAPVEPEAALPETRPRRVLIVEDNEDAAETLVEMVELWGHEVRLARTGKLALEEAEAYRPEVVLLDIGLPGLDGYEVARRLRAGPQSAVLSPRSRNGDAPDRGPGTEGRGPRTRDRRPGTDDRGPGTGDRGPGTGDRGPTLVAMTGYGQLSDRQRTAEAGFDYHLTKPVDPEELQGLLNRLPETDNEATAAR